MQPALEHVALPFSDLGLPVSVCCYNFPVMLRKRSFDWWTFIGKENRSGLIDIGHHLPNHQDMLFATSAMGFAWDCLGGFGA